MVAKTRDHNSTAFLVLVPPPCAAMISQENSCSVFPPIQPPCSNIRLHDYPSPFWIQLKLSSKITIRHADRAGCRPARGSAHPGNNFPRALSGRRSLLRLRPRSAADILRLTGVRHGTQARISSIRLILVTTHGHELNGFAALAYGTSAKTMVGWQRDLLSHNSLGHSLDIQTSM